MRGECGWLTVALWWAEIAPKNLNISSLLLYFDVFAAYKQCIISAMVIYAL
jgi:hypothetical protein